MEERFVFEEKMPAGVSWPLRVTDERRLCPAPLRRGGESFFGEPMFCQTALGSERQVQAIEEAREDACLLAINYLAN